MLYKNINKYLLYIFNILLVTKLWLLPVAGYTDLPAELVTNVNVDQIKDLKLQRKLFLQAEEELKKSTNAQKSEAIAKKFFWHLTNYPLYPYLESMFLQQTINQVSYAKMHNFVTNNSDTPLAKQLREAWLLAQAKKNLWGNFLLGYQDTDHPELNCYFIKAQMQTTSDLGKFDDQIRKIWLHNKAQPKACDVVFASWKQQGLMTKAMIWQRIKLAITAHQLKFAKFLANNYLISSERALVDLWIKVHSNPMQINQLGFFTAKDHPVIKEILIHGILQIAKKTPEQAIEIWRNLCQEHVFTERHYNLVVKSIAISLAKAVHPYAWEWLTKIAKPYRDQEVYNAQLILSLKQTKWTQIIKLYEELPQDLKNQEKWLYWYSRALESVHRGLDSKKLLIQLATKRSYYGFLASAKLLRPCNFKFKPITIDLNQIASILQNKAIQRAYELLQLERLNKASKEWSLALKSMVEWELHAAAKLAENLNMPNWAIIALSDAKEQDDLSLRFPKYYADYILHEAKQNQLDPAWVFAVTRQESAFRPDVRSYAGALGLMQVMPKTGFMLAQTMKINLRNHKDLLDINNNVKLGSKYLQLMLDRYKNMVVATAAYNAGPGRINKWLPEVDLAADIWVETIPFKDTKEYVQNVMTYTVIYQKLLDRNHYLHMPTVKRT